MAKPLSDKKRDQIFQAGLKLFAQNGYSNTTIKDIAKEAGVSFGTVFTYFKTKEDLFHTCVVEPLADFRKHILEVQDDIESLTLEKLKELISKHVDFFFEKEQNLRIIQYVIGQPSRFSEMEELDQFADDFNLFIQKIVKTGMKEGFLPNSDPEEVGYSYLAYLNGIRLTFTDHANVTLTNAFKNQALRLFGINN
ncbi:TetR/AcrR family transcriptional regulator [Virgibacillus flavescens]|uniref:TetR/AcrR family transcriptional regulator n=1 Tax=Virgibacillus flavescens TaxID=1611422 RepID=UPI003D33177E